jgi:Transglutaminase-like superfamily
VNGDAIAGSSRTRQRSQQLRPTTKGRLVAEILVTYGRARWLLWRRPLPDVVWSLRRSGAPMQGSDSDVVGRRLGRIVARTLGRLPFDSRCFVTSLVLTSMLARRGVESRLVIGVDVDPSFSAHAWVECDGEPLLPALNVGSRLVEL